MSSELPFTYRVVRSRRRRTASLSIDKGQVEVRVPALTDGHWIEQWVQTKRDWIVPRLQRQTQALEQHGVRIEEGARFWFGGSCYRLRWQRAPRSGVELEGTAIVVSVSTRVSRAEPEAVTELLKQWMVRRAQAELPARCRELGAASGLLPQQVKVRDYRRKWGQCSSRGQITLNWRLMHLAPALRDYVLIHELCHLQQMNHSPAFWALVAGHCPDYRQRRQEIQLAYPYLGW